MKSVFKRNPKNAKFTLKKGEHKQFVFVFDVGKKSKTGLKEIKPLNLIFDLKQSKPHEQHEID